ncbi:hypothetical protein [uncultured Treponema sp.]|uniref:hypothetical protein n=1 Tax=uncultured Treponema sp. TaxID=162155 RepID=UPI002609BB81|nr:hypothetical protein [uncultured Treponema sp.]
MKKIQTAALIFVLFTVTSCSAKKSYSAGGVPKQNKVANIIEEKIKEEESSDSRQQNEPDEAAGSGNYDNYYSYSSGTENDFSQNSSGSAQDSSSSSYDYYGSSFEEISAPKTDVELDLSKMNADFVYAFIFQIIVEPEKYEGKTIRMTGTFETFYDDAPYGRHDYCIITDVLACCAQGLEFESAKVSGVEPGQKITVSGTLKLRDALSPDGMEYKTMRIADAAVSS